MFNAGRFRIRSREREREAVDRVASSGLSIGAVAEEEVGLHETVLRARRSTTQTTSPSPSNLGAEVAQFRR